MSKWTAARSQFVDMIDDELYRCMDNVASHKNIGNTCSYMRDLMKCVIDLERYECARDEIKEDWEGGERRPDHYGNMDSIMAAISDMYDHADARGREMIKTNLKELRRRYPV